MKDKSQHMSCFIQKRGPPMERINAKIRKQGNLFLTTYVVNKSPPPERNTTKSRLNLFEKAFPFWHLFIPLKTPRAKKPRSPKCFFFETASR